MAYFVDIQNLGKNFDTSDGLLTRMFSRGACRVLQAVKNVSFSIEQGKTYALIGESGSGKSTIAKMVVGLLRPSYGRVLFDQHDLFDQTQQKLLHDRWRRQLQMVFQSPFASLNPRWRVGNIIAEPIYAFKLYEDEAHIAKQVYRLLDQVGLSQKDAEKYPHEFSGGQRQRISIARALASKPKFIVCDEPTSALDVSVQAQVLNMLKALQAEFGLTYLFITHDFAVVRAMAHRIAVLKEGELIEEGDAVELIKNPTHPYTKMLLESVPRVRKKRVNSPERQAAAFKRAVQKNR